MDEGRNLFIITGASCVGKSSVCDYLRKTQTDYIVFESDIFWHGVFDTPLDKWKNYRERWLKLCAQAADCGKSVILCGATVPEQLEPLAERKLFSEIHYLAIVCRADTLAERFAKRAETNRKRIADAQGFNAWLQENHAKTAPPITVLDTSDLSVEEAAKEVLKWIYHS